MGPVAVIVHPGLDDRSGPCTVTRPAGPAGPYEQGPGRARRRAHARRRARGRRRSRAASISPDATPAPVAVGVHLAVPVAVVHARADGLAGAQRVAVADAWRPAPRQPPSPTPEPTPSLVPAPLTGRLVKPEVASRHVIAVMVDDQFAARPQSGLSSADVVWQAPAEGGIPRYMALFQTGSPKAVGPVRSSRYYFIAWAAEWRSVYVHVGGSPQALALLRSSKGRGPVVYDADGFRYEGTLPVADHHPVRAAQRVHRREEPPDDGQEGRREGGRVQVALEVRPGQAALAAPEGRLDSSSRTSPTRSPTSTTARPTPTCGR